MIYNIPTCPNCERPIQEPFSRLSGPIAFVHRPHGHHDKATFCRLIITPTIGGDPSIRVVPWKDGVTLESELAKEIAAFDFDTYWKQLGRVAA